MVQKIYSEMHLVSCTKTHHDITDLVNHRMVKNTKTWISWEWKITFLQNKKILNLGIRWYILRSYCFVAEVTFKISDFCNTFLQMCGSREKLPCYCVWILSWIILLNYFFCFYIHINNTSFRLNPNGKNWLEKIYMKHKLKILEHRVLQIITYVTL